MAQTLTRLLIHIVFSTKDREELIPLNLEGELYAFLGGMCREKESPLLAAGGTSNHVHLLVSLSKNEALSDLVMRIKRDSTRWLVRREPACAGFHWQDGYSGFSIGQSQVEVLKRYFARQKEHHKRRTFQDELHALLNKYGVEFDERYIWR